MITYSEDQARACVPDAGTLQRGQQLAQPTKWANLGRTDSAAWGECAGSGAKPYLTGIDLREPAFKCSCPSRVFPCKHGAALLLLLARQAPLFTAPTPPAWLAEWLAKREQPPAGKKTAPAPAASAPAASAGALAAGADVAPAEITKDTPAAGVAPARLARMAQGVAELETWLLDMLRAGLATLDQQPARYWESQAARLVDDQLPGLAATVRELAILRAVHADWPARLLGRLGELYWLARAFQNREQLPAATRQQVLQEVGVSLKKEELPAYGPPVADEWRVLGQFSWEEDRLTARRSWLRGRASGRYALVLEFAFGGPRFATPLLPQGLYAGALHFYPGPLPLRAAPGELTYAGAAPEAAAPPAQRPGQLLDEYASALARQPWLREWPATLTGVVPVRQPDGRWLLHHPAEAGALPLRFAGDDAPWQLLARSGGRPLTLFGEWDGRAFRPLSSWLVTTETADAPPAAEPDPATDYSWPNSAALPAAGMDAPASVEPVEPALPAFALLLRLALLGTRQGGEVVPALPGLATPADGPEQRLLLGAGALALLHKAGLRPPAPAAAPPAPAPPETGHPLGPLGTASLRELLAGEFSSFQADYWAQMAQHQRLIPPELLVMALGYDRFRQQLPGPLSALLGERGQWLARQNPDWQPVLAAQDPAQAPAQDLATWETGTLPQRRFFLRRLHQADPERARALLAAALPHRARRHPGGPAGRVSARPHGGRRAPADQRFSCQKQGGAPGGSAAAGAPARRRASGAPLAAGRAAAHPEAPAIGPAEAPGHAARGLGQDLAGRGHRAENNQLRGWGAGRLARPAAGAATARPLGYPPGG